MHSVRAMLFGPNSLIEYIKYKNSIWVRIRESYRQLQLHQRKLETFLKEPKNPSTARRADDIFQMIVCHWAVIIVAKRAFEGALHKYKLTAPSDLEMALYREYLLFGEWIKESCKASLAKAGFVYPKTQ